MLRSYMESRNVKAMGFACPVPPPPMLGVGNGSSQMRGDAVIRRRILRNHRLIDALGEADGGARAGAVMKKEIRLRGERAAHDFAVRPAVVGQQNGHHGIFLGRRVAVRIRRLRIGK